MAEVLCETMRRILRQRPIKLLRNLVTPISRALQERGENSVVPNYDLNHIRILVEQLPRIPNSLVIVDAWHYFDSYLAAARANQIQLVIARCFPIGCDHHVIRDLSPFKKVD